MSTLEDLIFGSDSEADISAHPTRTPEQMDTLNQLMALLSGELGGFNTNPELSGQGQDIQSMLNSLLPMFEGGGSTLQDLLSGEAQNIDEVFTSTVQDPLLRNFRENVLPGIGRKYGGNFFGSDRREADTRASEDLIQTLSSERSRFSFNANEAAQNRRLGALNAIPGMSAGATNFAQFGDLQYTRGQDAQDRRMQIINALLGVTGQQTIENIGLVTPGQPGGLTAFLQGLGQGAGKSAGGG